MEIQGARIFGPSCHFALPAIWQIAVNGPETAPLYKFLKSQTTDAGTSVRPADPGAACVCPSVAAMSAGALVRLVVSWWAAANLTHGSKLTICSVLLSDKLHLIPHVRSILL